MPLFICATPIGNLSDTSSRLLETLHNVDRIVAEDTRTTLKLLNHFGIKKPLSHLEKHNEIQATKQVMIWLRNGQNVALLSDAGTPTISDPGALCIAECQKEKIPVIPIPGPSAVTTLLSASGLPADHYVFTGFFPRKESEKQTWWDTWGKHPVPLVFFETSNRLLETTTWLCENAGTFDIVAGKELTKQFETILCETSDTILKKLNETTIKGEWVIALLPHRKTEDKGDEKKLIKKLIRAGFSQKDIKTIAECMGYNKNDWYKEALQSEK